MTDSRNPSPQDFLQQLFGSGKEMFQGGKGELSDQARELGKRGEDTLLDVFGMEDTPENRDYIRKQAKYAGAAGALALLLKSRSARKFATLGGLAALGTIAYRGHKRGAMPTSFKEAVGLLSGKAADDRASILLKAMVAAARADGNISVDERALLEAYPDANMDELTAMLSTPADPRAIAEMATDDQIGAEIYAVSARICDGLNPLERNYLDSLAMALRLDPEAAAHIETDVRMGE